MTRRRAKRGRGAKGGQLDWTLLATPTLWPAPVDASKQVRAHPCISSIQQREVGEQLDKERIKPPTEGVAHNRAPRR
jgi:hypothetical protein